MITPPSKTNIYIKDLPFKANLDKKNKRVSFVGGYVVNCYSQEINNEQEFKNGCSYKYLDGSFDFEYGDSFYVDARYQVEHSSIKKISKNQMENFPNNDFEIPVLIWKSPQSEKGEGEQFLSENIFIQDYESCRSLGLRFKKTEDEKILLTPGYITCPQKNFEKLLTTNINNESPLRIKINVSIEKSEEDPYLKGDVSYIKDFKIQSVSLEEVTSEEEEDNPPFLSLNGDSLSGFYFIDLPSNSGGVFILKFSASSISLADVSPGFETQVRGAKFYKNGVSTSLFNPSDLIGEEGFYKAIEQEKIYDKFSFDEETGEVDLIGEYSILTRFYVEGESNISEGSPEILSEISQEELGENEFIIGPKETIVTSDGGEISGKAYSECRNIATDFSWTPIAIWNGDSTPAIQGAGAEGLEDKLNPFVIHAERRFKRVGIPSAEAEDLNMMPSSFDHYSIIQWSDASEEDISGSIKFDKEKIIYIDKSFQEIEFKGDGVYGIELVLNEAEIEGEGSLKIDITKNVKIKYQTLEMTTTSSAVV